MNIDGARGRWVDLVDDARDFFRGEPVIRRLLLEPDRGRLRRFLNFTIHGPDKRLALTDPALFRLLHEVCRRALLAGWAVTGSAPMVASIGRRAKLETSAPWWQLETVGENQLAHSPSLLLQSVIPAL